MSIVIELGCSQPWSRSFLFQWTVDNTETHNRSKCCESKTECSALTWPSLSPTHFLRSREHSRRGNGKNVRPRAQEECYGMQSSGPDVTVALLNSVPLWIPAQDLYKIKPARMSQRWDRRSPGSTPYSRATIYYNWQVMATRRGNHCLFFEGVATGRFLVD